MHFEGLTVNLMQSDCKDGNEEYRVGQKKWTKVKYILNDWVDIFLKLLLFMALFPL